MFTPPPNAPKNWPLVKQKDERCVIVLGRNEFTIVNNILVGKNMRPKKAKKPPANPTQMKKETKRPKKAQTKKKPKEPRTHPNNARK
jgi:hypothetical protein